MFGAFAAVEEMKLIELAAGLRRLRTRVGIGTPASDHRWTHAIIKRVTVPGALVSGTRAETGVRAGYGSGAGSLGAFCIGVHHGTRGSHFSVVGIGVSITGRIHPQ